MRKLLPQFVSMNSFINEIINIQLTVEDFIGEEKLYSYEVICEK